MVRTERSLPDQRAEQVSESLSPSNQTVHAHPPIEPSRTVTSNGDVNQQHFRHNHGLRPRSQPSWRPPVQGHAPPGGNADSDSAISRPPVTVAKQRKSSQKPKGYSDATPAPDMPMAAVGPVVQNRAVKDTQNVGRSATATPVKGAYAGPTFHASPAPSSLPVPRFFSMSVPSPGSTNSLQARLDEESAERNSGLALSKQRVPSPPVSGAQIGATPTRNDSSPLDFFFKADMEEKARLSRGGSAVKLDTAKRRPDSAKSPLATEMVTLAAPSPSSHSRRPSDSSGKGLFRMDYEEAAQASPIHGSFKALSSVRQPEYHRSAKTTQGTPDKDLRLSKSEALKELLFSSGAESARPTQPRIIPDDVGSERTQRTTSYASGRHRGNAGPSAALPTSPPPISRPDDLYYGNRNLSPLFRQSSDKPRPNARTHSAGFRGANASPTHLSDKDSNPLPPASTSLSPTPGQGRQSGVSEFSRNYLDSHLRGTPSTHNPERRSVQGSVAPANGVQPPVQQASRQTKSVQGMEQDLRRMLNLHAFGSEDASSPDQRTVK